MQACAATALQPSAWSSNVAGLGLAQVVDLREHVVGTFTCHPRWVQRAAGASKAASGTACTVVFLALLAVPVFGARQPARNRRRGRGTTLKTSLKSASLDLPEIAFGTWAWGNRLLWQYTPEMDAELRQVFDLCVQRGAFLFDTGDTYGTGDLDGRSEMLLGQFSSQLPSPPWPLPQPRLVLATKWAPKLWRLTRESLVDACRDSTKRMGRVDLGQLHWPPAFFQETQLLDGLCDVYEQDLVRGVGLSNYGPKGLRRVHAQLQKRGVPLATAQTQFSLLTENNDEFVETCRELGVRPIAYSPLCLGLLSGKFSGPDAADLPPPPRGWLFGALMGNSEFDKLIDLISAIAKERGKTMPQVAINWCVCKGALPLVGAKTVLQAEENLGGIGWRLSDGEVRALDEQAARAPKTQPNPAAVP